MNFELGKEYIVKVSEEGIVPIEEFRSDRFYDKDHDDLDFLTDEEKKLVVSRVLSKLRSDIEGWQTDIHDNEHDANNHDFVFERIFELIDEYNVVERREEDDD